ncbi:HI0074 family nucleotidyltransferase substrate-binding subunit [Cytobacillus sp. S13-E01]|uniref:HI0074 family nucleotidyltransferase substrate-binding subunit n=1 Tax=Cytobacillus sp. S13-E01 TaxID=3031326 RepID=UPI0023D8AE1A|nr:HI0074 family nucleotidyltransferase substrate-binding subunit [Cytobacillus sp. S13-E01]MDF0728240.1 HI0074 family nucleotidyltransferase substrate-binding subunit [Cytobacillus sp. S13-E01]
MKESNINGLSKSNFYKIIKIFEKYSDIIEAVLLFGSRARGDFKSTSDIDLAIKFRKDNNQLYKISDSLSEENIIYTFDIIDYEKISNEKLKDYIDKEGKIIFLTSPTGQVMDNMNKVKDKLADLQRAYNKLHECLERDASKDDLVIDATIQRFEFTYELSWKLMKTYLEYNGNLEVTSPRRTIREAFKDGILSDGEKWLKMLEDRNRTSHTYNEDIALEIYKNIKEDYITLFDALLSEMKVRII